MPRARSILPTMTMKALWLTRGFGVLEVFTVDKCLKSFSGAVPQILAVANQPRLAT